MQGWRQTMEDAYVATGSLGAEDSDWKDVAMFAVFDGHGGCQTATSCAMRFPQAIIKGRVSKAGDMLRRSFFDVDQALAKHGNHDDV